MSFSENDREKLREGICELLDFKHLGDYESATDVKGNFWVLGIIALPATQRCAPSLRIRRLLSAMR